MRCFLVLEYGILWRNWSHLDLIPILNDLDFFFPGIRKEGMTTQDTLYLWNKVTKLLGKSIWVNFSSCTASFFKCMFEYFSFCDAWLIICLCLFTVFITFLRDFTYAEVASPLPDFHLSFSLYSSTIVSSLPFHLAYFYFCPLCLQLYFPCAFFPVFPPISRFSFPFFPYLNQLIDHLHSPPVELESENFCFTFLWTWF